jgi:hypothetical protein
MLAMVVGRLASMFSPKRMRPPTLPEEMRVRRIREDYVCCCFCSCSCSCGGCCSVDCAEEEEGEFHFVCVVLGDVDGEESWEVEGIYT